MAATLSRLLTLLALMLMPVGMASAPAGAHPLPAPVASGQCADHHNTPDTPPAPAKSGIDCALMCLALPAAEASATAAPPVLERSMLIATAMHIAGIEPEMGTPPPKA